MYEASAFAVWAEQRVFASETQNEIGPVLLLDRWRLGCTEERSAKAEFFRAVAVGEEPEVSHAHEARGQDVLKEAADELFDFERHDFLDTAVFVIAPSEGDFAVAHFDESMVRDGDAVDVAAEVVQSLFGSAEWLFGHDAPLLRLAGCYELPEYFWLREVFNCAVKFEASLVEGFLEGFEKVIAEVGGEDSHGQKEAGAAGDPCLSVGTQAAAGYNTVNVRMVREGLAPSVQNGQEADRRAEMLWVRGNGL